MRVFLAEKEILAGHIVDAIGGTIVKKDGYVVCGSDDVVTWASGHMYEQAPPEHYDSKYERWNAAHLPIVPPKWEILPVSNKLKQLERIHALLAKADTIVQACDFDREGQLIGDEIIMKAPKLKQGVQILRLKIDATNKASLQKAMQNMRPNKEFLAMSLAALARSRADWLTGMNLTRAYSLAGIEAGYERETFSIGRVQTPTLALIVDRDREIRRFKPMTYYLGGAVFKLGQDEIVAKWEPPDNLQGVDAEKRVIKKEVAEAMVQRVKGKRGQVSKYEVEEEHEENAPLPLNLAELQDQAIKKYGLTANETLAAAQSLYERHRLISYPRTDCRYLPESDHGEALSVLHAIAKNDPEKAPLCQQADTTIVSEAWNNEKLESHYAIVPVPTIVDTSLLSAHERGVYDLVCRAYVAQFFPPAKFRIVKVEILVAQDLFKVGEREMTSAGWKALYPPKSETTSEKVRLPEMKVGDRPYCEDADIVEKQTTPPQAFDDGSLMKAMRNIDKLIEDKDMRERLAGAKGIGTPATRAEIIENLIEKKYILRTDKKKLLSTKKARQLIDSVKEEVKSPSMTAYWEMNVEQIANGHASVDNFLQRQVEFIKELIASASVKPKDMIDEDDEDAPEAGGIQRKKRTKRRREAA